MSSTQLETLPNNLADAIVSAPDNPLQRLQFGFGGKWIPSSDPLKIGPENFITLDNMDYIDNGVEGCLGYSKINTSAIPTYLYMRSGIQLRVPHPDRFEKIVNSVDRSIGTSNHWTNVDIASFNNTDDITISATAAGQYCYLPGTMLKTLASGETYTITYDAVVRNTGFYFAYGTAGGPVTIGTIVAGTSQTIDFTPSAAVTNIQILSTASGDDCDVDNISIRPSQAGKSYVLVHAQNPTAPDTDKNRVRVNKTTIPNQGNFESGTGSVVYTDADYRLTGRFSEAPNNHIAFNNTLESCIYGGEFCPLAAFFTVRVASGPDGFEDLGSPYDYSDIINNTLETAGNTVSINNVSDTVLLLHFAEDYTDSSDSDHTVEANDDDGVMISTDFIKFGTGSAKFVAEAVTKGYLYSADSADWNMGANPFIIEMQILFGSSMADGVYGLFGQADSAAANAYGIVTISGTATSYKFEFFMNGASIVSCTAAIADGFTPDIWNHIEIGRGWDSVANTFYIAINGGGTFLGTGTSAATWGDMAGVFEIGRSPKTFSPGPSAWDYLGHTGSDDIYLDEFRIIKGRTPHTEVFNQPQGPYFVTNTGMLLFTTRPATSFYFLMKSRNVQTSAMRFLYWGGESFINVKSSLYTDGTDNSGKTLGRDGRFELDSDIDIDNMKPFHFGGLYLYCYYMEPTEASVEIINITAGIPFQTCKDNWDGIYRQPILCRVWRNKNSKFEDFTLQVNKDSDTNNPMGAILDGLSTDDYMEVMFEERMSAMWFDILAGKENHAATSALTCQYWDGGDYATVSVLRDESLSSSVTLAKSGLLSWNPPSESAESKKSIDGKKGYAYKFKPTVKLSGEYPIEYTSNGIWFKSNYDPSNTPYDDIIDDNATGTPWADAGFAVGDTIEISGSAYNDEQFNVCEVSGNVLRVKNDDGTGHSSGMLLIPEDKGHDITIKISGTDRLQIDRITGVPAPLTVKPFKFSVLFKNSLLQCGYVVGNQGNRVDFTPPAMPDVYNGALSSQDGRQSLYFGGQDELTSGTQIYNRIGANIHTIAIMHKRGETYLLDGTGPDDYRIFTVSTRVGNPAPNTLDVAELGYEVTENERMNIAIWLSNSGPVIFDGVNIYPVWDDIRNYFDPNDSSFVGVSNIESAVGKVDQTHLRYHLIIPNASLWFVYDLRRRRWTKRTGMTYYPKVLISVRDRYGAQYLYGCCDDGYMRRIDNGTTWDGTAITYVVEPGELLLTKDLWDVALIRNFKMWNKRLTEGSAAVTVAHYADTSTTATSGAVANISLTTGSAAGKRLTRTTVSTNLAAEVHRFKFSCALSATTKGWQPFMWGIAWRLRRWAKGSDV